MVTYEVSASLLPATPGVLPDSTSEVLPAPPPTGETEPTPPPTAEAAPTAESSPETPLQFIDFCDSLGNWDTIGFTVSTSQYYVGSPPSSFYSGQGNNLNNVLVMKNPVHIYAGDCLCYKYYCNTESMNDIGYVEISTDKYTWTQIAGFSGSECTWEGVGYNLSFYVGQNIYLRFRYVTNASVISEGFYIDDVLIYKYL